MTDLPADELVARWRRGDEQAAAELFDRYAGRLITLARTRLPVHLVQRFDAEDVVQSAYRSFFARSKDGRIEVRLGADIWRLLVAIVLNKLRSQVRHNSAEKRSVRKEWHQGGGAAWDAESAVLAEAPSPLEALTLIDELEQFMRGLTPLQRQMVELRLQGHDHAEIAALVQRAEITVRRALTQVKDELEKRKVKLEREPTP